MSELENKMEETPKRRRRTKAEIEEAKANGTYKPKKKAVKAEVKESEEKPVEAKKTISQRPPEQSVLLMACLEPRVSKAAIQAANDLGVEVVILEDKIIYDYLEAKTKKPDSLSDFLSNSSNRLHAEEQCRKLYAILTNGGRIEDSFGMVFTASQVVKATSLSHSKAKEVFNLLRAFGLITFTKGFHEFIFTFSPELRRQSIRDEILGVLRVTNTDIERYKWAIESDDSLTKEMKDEIYKQLQMDIDSIIEY